MAGSPKKRSRRMAEEGVIDDRVYGLNTPEFSHPRLDFHGYAKAGREADNILTHGYESIRAHYIEGAGDLPDAALARVWQVPPSTLYTWKERGRWDELRQKRLDSLPVQQGGNRADEKISKLREWFFEMTLALLYEAIEITMARLRHETEERVSATGTVCTLRKGAASHKAEVEALLALLSHVRMALGLPNKVTAEAQAPTYNTLTFNIIRPSEAEVEAYLAEEIAEFGDYLPE